MKRGARAREGKMRMAARAASKGGGRCASESTDGAIRARQSVRASVTLRIGFHRPAWPGMPHPTTRPHRDDVSEADDHERERATHPPRALGARAARPLRDANRRHARQRRHPVPRGVRRRAMRARRRPYQRAGRRRWFRWGDQGLARVLCGLRATCESVLVRSWASQAPGVVRVGRKWTATREGPLRPTRPSGAIDQAIPSLVRLALSRSTHARKKEEGKTSSMCDCRAKLETWREPRKEGGTDGEGETQDGATQERRDERERENLHERGNKTESETRRERERTSFWGGSRLGAGTRRRGGHERDETPRATVYFLPALSQSLTCCMRARCVSTRRTQTASKRSGEGRTMSANETMQTCRHGAESTVSNAPSSKTSLDVEGTRAAPSARCRAQCAASRRGTGP